MRFRTLAVGVVIGALLAGAVVAFGLVGHRGDQGTDLTTDTDSSSIPTAEARVTFISRYLKLRGAATDATFSVVFHDNSHGMVPGPSDWSIVASLRVSPRDRDAWLMDATRVTPEEARDTLATRTRRPIPSDWGVSSPGETYRRGTAVLTWHPEGVFEISSTSLAR